MFYICIYCKITATIKITHISINSHNYLLCGYVVRTQDLSTNFEYITQ